MDDYGGETSLIPLDGEKSTPQKVDSSVSKNPFHRSIQSLQPPTMSFLSNNGTSDGTNMPFHGSGKSSFMTGGSHAFQSSIWGSRKEGETSTKPPLPPSASMVIEPEEEEEFITPKKRDDKMANIPSQSISIATRKEKKRMFEGGDQGEEELKMVSKKKRFSPPPPSPKSEEISSSLSTKHSQVTELIERCEGEGKRWEVEVVGVEVKLALLHYKLLQQITNPNKLLHQVDIISQGASTIR